MLWFLIGGAAVIGAQRAILAFADFCDQAHWCEEEEDLEWIQ